MNSRTLPRAGEHRYYVAAAIGVIVVVLAGFSIDVPLLSHLGSLSVLVLFFIAKALTRSEESVKDRAKADGLTIAKLR